LKGTLKKEEINSFLEGFSDSMLDKVADEPKYLNKYGPQFAKIMSDRASQVLIEQKNNGNKFIAKYLLKNKNAATTTSGLVYDEKLQGDGVQVLI
jgi:hypothetical protein